MPEQFERGDQASHGGMSSASPTAKTWDMARKLLCVRLDNMGDVLMTSPAIAALAGAGASTREAQRPALRRHITLLASPAGVAAARHLPDIDAVMTCRAPWIKADDRTERDLFLDPDSGHALLRELRECNFDAAVIFTVYSQSPLPAALLCTWAGIPLRLACSRENPYALLSDWVREREPQEGVRHEVQRQLDLVATVGAHVDDVRLRFAVADADRAGLAMRLAAYGLQDARDLVVIHPGASAPSRRYPSERYAELARALTSMGCKVIVAGSASEEALVADVAAACGASDASGASCVTGMAGELTLGELGALIETAVLLISNNSGPVHIAAALGTPVVDLYALTNPQHTPWQVPHRLMFFDVPCKYCYQSICPKGHHLCLRGVQVADVLGAARQLLPLKARHLRLEPESPGRSRGQRIAHQRIAHLCSTCLQPP